MARSPGEEMAVGRIAPRAGTPPAEKRTNRQAAGPSFEQALGSASLRFSKHAQERLAERGLELGPAHLQRLEGAVDRAAAKGARDSLVLMDDLALVVSVRNRTVITAVDAASGGERVFTNIDSVVLAQ